MSLAGSNNSVAIDMTAAIATKKLLRAANFKNLAGLAQQLAVEGS